MPSPYSNPAPISTSPDRIEGWQPVEIIPIGEAVLCADCEGITRAKNGHCLACGRRSIVHVEKLMNRQIDNRQSSIGNSPGEAR